MNRKDIVFYLIGKRYKFNIIEYYRFVLESQYWETKKIEEYQSKKLQEIIQHAYDNVPYYTKLLNKYGYKPSDFKHITDLKKLPILTKEIINKNFNDFLAKNYKQYNPIDRYTGGTTGAAFHLYNDMNSWAINWATKIRAFSWANYEFGNNKLAVMAGGSLLPKSKMGIKNKIWRYANNYYSMPITHMNNEILAEYATNLEKRKIKFLRGYPSSIYTLANFLKVEKKKLD